MTNNTCTAVSVPAFVECQVCFDSWRNPVQVFPCGHIFCSHCIPNSTAKCFICRVPIEKRQPPNSEIIERALEIPVMCSTCGWRGSRKASEVHRCDCRETHTTLERYGQKTDEQWVQQVNAQIRGEPESRPAEAPPAVMNAIVMQ